MAELYTPEAKKIFEESADRIGDPNITTPSSQIRKYLSGEAETLEKARQVQIPQLPEEATVPGQAKYVDPDPVNVWLTPLVEDNLLDSTQQYYNRGNQVWSSPAAYSPPPTQKSWEPYPLSDILFIRETSKASWDDTISAAIVRNLNVKAAQGEISSTSEYFDQWRTGNQDIDWAVDLIEKWFDFYKSDYRELLEVSPLEMPTLPENAGKQLSHEEAKKYLEEQLGERASKIELQPGLVQQEYLDIVIAANRQQQYISLLTQLTTPSAGSIAASIIASFPAYFLDPSEFFAQFPAAVPYFHTMMDAPRLVSPIPSGPGGRWRNRSVGMIVRNWQRWWRGFHPTSMGASVAEPFAILAAQQEQIDYGVGDSIINILAGGAIGGVFHVGIGAVGDLTTIPRALRTSGTGARYVDTLTPEGRGQVADQVSLQAERGQQIDIAPLVIRGVEVAPPSVRLDTFLDVDRAARQTSLPSSVADNYARAVSEIRLRSQQTLWNLAQAGEVMEDGFPSPVLQAAQVARGRGGLQDFQTFQKFADDVIRADRQDISVRQDAIQNVIERYAPSKIAPGDRVVARGIGRGTVVSLPEGGYFVRFDPDVPAPGARVIKPTQRKPFPLYKEGEYPRFDTLRGKYEPGFTDEDIIKQIETLTNAEPAGPINRSNYTQSNEQVVARGKVSDDDIMNDVLEELDRVGVENLPPAVRADIEQSNKDISLANEQADAAIAGADCLATRGK